MQIMCQQDVMQNEIFIPITMFNVSRESGT